MYRLFFHLVLARFDPERAHSLALIVIRMCGLPIIGAVIRTFTKPSPRLSVTTLGVKFSSPFGLAAGFDKDAAAIRGLGNLGFGHVEVGTLTAQPQPGNPGPRLFRLVPDRALINRMGFNNGGAANAVTRLRTVRELNTRPVVGVNIGKSRVVNVEAAADDYLESARLLAPVADYLVVNVSSPNTPGLRGLQEADRLRPLLRSVKEAAGVTPVLVKIAPDLGDPAIVELCGIVTELALGGIIATNTTLSREGLATDADVVESAGAGGLSGRPLASRSLDVLKLVRSSVPAELCIVSVGGVESARDVAERIRAGATLVQGYTGFIYRGPLWAAQINRSLARILKRETARA